MTSHHTHHQLHIEVVDEAGAAVFLGIAKSDPAKLAKPGPRPSVHPPG